MDLLANIIFPIGNFGVIMFIKKTSEIGKIIKETRVKQNMTQVRLAATSGVGVRFIVDLEKGKKTASLGKTRK
jgi:DNA-binding XRE family transcriptional regulator